MTKALVFVLLAITAVCWGQQREEVHFGEVIENYDRMTEMRSIGMTIDITMDRIKRDPPNMMWLQFVRAESKYSGAPDYFVILLLRSQGWWFINKMRVLADDERFIFEIKSAKRNYLEAGTQEICLFNIDLHFIKTIMKSEEVILRFVGSQGTGDFNLKEGNKQFLANYVFILESKDSGI